MDDHSIGRLAKGRDTSRVRSLYGSSLGAYIRDLEVLSLPESFS
jgi:hypothetical protein